MTLGPVQIIAIEFDSLDGMRGQILGELDDLSPVASVRILDALFVAKDQSGDLLALEAGELGEDELDETLGLLVGQLMGFEIDGDDGSETAETEGADPSPLGMSPADVERIGNDLALGTGALLLLVEHRWATDLRDAVAEAGGRMVAQGFLTPDGVLMLGAELAATAAAIDAVETAMEAEAVATVKALEALATIEIAAEVEAAVVARTIRVLMEAGFIEQAAVDHAAAAVIDAALIDQAISGR
jgi:hypothetical protein